MSMHTRQTRTNTHKHEKSAGSRGDEKSTKICASFLRNLIFLTYNQGFLRGGADL